MAASNRPRTPFPGPYPCPIPKVAVVSLSRVRAVKLVFVDREGRRWRRCPRRSSCVGHPVTGYTNGRDQGLWPIRGSYYGWSFPDEARRHSSLPEADAAPVSVSRSFHGHQPSPVGSPFFLLPPRRCWADDVFWRLLLLLLLLRALLFSFTSPPPIPSLLPPESRILYSSVFIPPVVSRPRIPSPVRPPRCTYR